MCGPATTSASSRTSAHLSRAVEDLQGRPRSVDQEEESAKTWTYVAQAHPEFFRVDPEADRAISLVARHATPNFDDKGGREPLTADFVGNLLRSAVEIHDRQVRRSERWTYLLPIWVVLIAGIFGLVTALVRSFL